MRTPIALLIAFLFPPAAGATVIVPAEFREVVLGSEVIVTGRVVDVRAEWSDDRRRIDSFVTVEVATTLRGRATDTVTFIVPGGQIGRYRSITIGAPVFAPGDEAVLFLNVREGSVPFVFGLNQGVYRVRTDTRTRQRVVVPPALLARSAAPEPVMRGDSSRRPVPVDAFHAQVREILAAEAAGSGSPR